MPINSPIPVKLQEETRKAAKILRSFVDTHNNTLDKVVPISLIERAAGFAIFTVFKAGFLFSARAGSGVVIARLPDGSWSAPSAIGLGGFGFGGQAGAEVTDFLIVLNSRAAVTSFMSAGSLTLGGNLSIAVGPLGRNAEGSGAVNAKGKMAAMYSYSKTKGLFGGVSVEGSVIVERQDANRLAYGGTNSVRQILNGSIDPPDWAYVLIEEIERCTSHGMPGGHKWIPSDEEDDQGPAGGRRRSDSAAGAYAFGGGIGPTPTATTPTGRRRAGSLFGSNDKDKTSPSSSPRPGAGAGYKRSTSFSLNPLTSKGSSSPRRAGPLPSSENYNAGLTWDSNGPMSAYGSRSRSGSNARRPVDRASASGPFADDVAEVVNINKARLPSRGTGDDLLGEPEKDKDLLGAWSADGNGLAANFGRLSTVPSATVNGNRSRSGSRSKAFDDILEDDPYVPHETVSNIANGGGGRAPFGSPVRLTTPTKTGRVSRVNDRPFSYNSPSTNHTRSPFGDDIPERQPFDDYAGPTSSPSPSRSRPPSSIHVREGLDDTADGYARAIALYDFAATDAGDLGFKKGQVVSVLDVVSRQQGGEWWKGRRTDGRVGIFPKKYVEVLFVPKDLKGGVWRSELKSRTADLGFE
ncbi:hypothetical protein BCR39DRAFT_521261 [Naematelia encephala]|uniref:SH3 domain-containing protein n=1 Tax=Naematelia encephala TaxID=71784 RepID=A0A1Y2BE44_9TREE|nr:hypothetical protein BCR39DRAFT_521261 [Naematelia encephala]